MEALNTINKLNLYVLSTASAVTGDTFFSNESETVRYITWLDSKQIFINLKLFKEYKF